MDFSLQYTKLKQARQKCRELKRSMQASAKNPPYGLDAVIDKDKLGWTLYLRMKDELPSEEWEMLFNEGIHLLRTLLDNAVMTITKELKLHPANIKLVCFPICATRKEWRNSQKNISHLPKKYKKRIEDMQPFNQINPYEDGLLAIQKLDNENKHYLQVRANIKTDSVDHQAGIEFESEEAAARSIPPNVTVYAPELKDGEILLRQTTKGRISRVRGGYKLTIVVSVNLQNKLYPISSLDGLCDFVERALNYLCEGETGLK